MTTPETEPSSKPDGLSAPKEDIQEIAKPSIVARLWRAVIGNWNSPKRDRPMWRLSTAWDDVPVMLGVFVLIMQVIIGVLLSRGDPGSQPVWNRMSFLNMAVGPWVAWLLLYGLLKLRSLKGRVAPAGLRRAVRQLSSGVVAWWIGVGWFMVLQSMTAPQGSEVFAGYDTSSSIEAGTTLLMTGALVWLGNFVAHGRLQGAEEIQAAKQQKDLEDQLDRIEAALRSESRDESL
jgi:hypothetical protein